MLFEAGALAKSFDKSHVVPLLFNLEPSDLSDSPLLQFQAAKFSKDEINKLIQAINNASQPKLDLQVLETAFSQWYPSLDKELQDIPICNSNKSTDNSAQKNVDDNESEKSAQVLEEILALSRENQKLLRNPATVNSNELNDSFEKLERLCSRLDMSTFKNRNLNHSSIMLRYGVLELTESLSNFNYIFLIYLSLFKDDYPWIYDLGKDLFDTLKFDKPQQQKHKAINDFEQILADTLHLMPVRAYGTKLEMLEVTLFQEFRRLLRRFAEQDGLQESTGSGGVVAKVPSQGLSDMLLDGLTNNK